MTLSEIDSRITMYTGASGGASGQFNTANRLISVNKAYLFVNGIILSSEDECDFDDTNNTNFSSKKTNLVANQPDYTLPTDLLRLKSVRISYDGITWYRANPLDVNEIYDSVGSSNDTGNFETTKPFYDIVDNSIVIYPTPSQNVTNGLKIQLTRSVTQFSSSDYTTGTKSPGFNVLFHDIIPLMASYDWLSTRSKDFATADRIKSQINELEARIREEYGNKQLDRQSTFSGYYGLSDFS